MAHNIVGKKRLTPSEQATRHRPTPNGTHESAG